MKPLKEIDSIHQTIILKTFCVISLLVSFLGWVLYGLVGILYAGVICVIVAFVSVFISDGIIFNSKGTFQWVRRPTPQSNLVVDQMQQINYRSFCE